VGAATAALPGPGRSIQAGGQQIRQPSRGLPLSGRASRTPATTCGEGSPGETKPINSEGGTTYVAALGGGSWLMGGGLDMLRS
jgi:hypothetical protein